MSQTNNTIFRLQVQGDQQVVQKFKQVAQSMQQINPAAKGVQQSTTQASNALKSTGQAATQSSTGLKSYGGALSSLGSSTTQAKTSTDAFSGSLTGFTKTNTAAVGGLNQTNTVTKGLVPTMGSLDTEVTKTGKSVGGLTNFFRGNRGLIFSVTMLSSGISEAISMFQGYQDASEKLAAAKEKVADMEERGLQNTKDYGEAVKDASDAQRGFNFIQRFTIQSFADLAPMSLMLTSSLMDMTTKVGGLSAVKTKLAGILPKVTQGIIAMGAAMRAFTLSHPLLLLLTALIAAGLAIVTNFMGVRDALNQIGVAVGNAIGPLKGLLEQFGLHANGVLDTANSYLQFGQTAVAATTDVEKQVLKTGDATKMSYDEQIALMAKLGEESKTIAFSLGAHLKLQQDDQEAHKTKYAQFVEAMQTGNQDIMQSLKLTADEYKTFSDQFVQETEALDEAWGTAVESILENWSKVNEGFGTSVDSTVGEIIKLEDKIAELREESFELDSKKELKKNREEIAKNEQKIEELRGTTSTSLGDMSALYEIFGSSVQQATDRLITPKMEQAGRDFIALGDQAKKGIDAIQLGILSQDFKGALNSLSTAIDGVPEKYQGNFSEIDAIIGNSVLTQRQKVAQIVAEFGSLEAAFKPLINGAYELSRADAELAAGLDEVAVAVRSNMTSMEQAEGAWTKFINALEPAQVDLPIIQDLMARLQAGTITHAEALQEAEAAGVAWSKTMGEDVMTSIKNVEKSFIDMGDGTSAMVANVNGSMVNLGRVSNTELGNLSDDLGGVQGSMGDTAKSAKDDIENEATAAVGVFGKDGKFHFGTVVKTAQGTIDVFKALDIYADKYIAKGATTTVGGLAQTMKDTSKVGTTETGSWIKSVEDFANKAKTAIDGVITTLGEMWNKLTGQGGGGDEEAQQLPKHLSTRMNEMQRFDRGRSLFGTGLDKWGRQQNATLADDMTGLFEESGQSGGMAALTTAVKALHAAWSSFSTSMATYSKSIIASVTNMQKTFSTFSTSIMTYSNSMKTNLLAFFSSMGQAFPMLDQLVKVHQQTWSTFSTSISTYANSMATNVLAFFAKMGQAFPMLDQLIKVHQQTWSTFSTSVATYATSMTANVVAFFAKMGQGFPMLDQLIKLHHKTWSTFSTSVATYTKSMSTNTTHFQRVATQAFNTISSGILKVQGASSKLSTTWSTHMKSMTSAVQKFSSTAVSSFNKVVSAANKLVSALNKVAAAARKAASAASKVGGMMHGGSFIASAQHGFSGIVNRPTTFKGVRMGESFRPELVTVQPLTRGTGNHGGPTVSSKGGGGGDQPIINNINVILDGRVIQRFVEKTALKNIGMQI